MTELETLLTLEKQTPNDDNLLSQIALTYVKTPFNQNNDLKYFKKAYEVNPSIKNTHNYAFWAYYEYGEDELALGLFKELMDKNPKSFYPYMAYGEFLLGRTNLAEDFKILKENRHQLIKLYQEGLKKFHYTHAHYTNTHRYELVWIYNNLASVDLVNDELENAKIFLSMCIK